MPEARHWYVDPFSIDSDYEGEQVARTEGALQNHQCEDEQGLEYIVTCTEAECRKSVLKISTEEMVESRIRFWTSDRRQKN